MAACADGCGSKPICIIIFYGDTIVSLLIQIKMVPELILAPFFIHIFDYIAAVSGSCITHHRK